MQEAVTASSAKMQNGRALVLQAHQAFDLLAVAAMRGTSRLDFTSETS